MGKTKWDNNKRGRLESVFQGYLLGVPRLLVKVGCASPCWFVEWNWKHSRTISIDTLHQKWTDWSSEHVLWGGCVTPPSYFYQFGTVVIGERGP